MTPLETDRFIEADPGKGRVRHLSKARLGNILKGLGLTGIQGESRGISFAGANFEGTLFAEARNALAAQLRELPSQELTRLVCPDGFSSLGIEAIARTFQGHQEPLYSAKILTEYASIFFTNYRHEIAYEMALLLCLPRQFIEAAACGQQVVIVSHHGNSRGKEQAYTPLYRLTDSAEHPGIAVVTFNEEIAAQKHGLSQADKIFVVHFP